MITRQAPAKPAWIWPQRSPRVNQGSRLGSNRRRRREKAPPRAVRLLAAPVLAIMADLHFLERDDLIEPAQEVAAVRLLDFVARQLNAIGDPATMRAVDGTDKV